MSSLRLLVDPQTSDFVLVAVRCVHAEGSCSPQICQHHSVPFKVNPLQSLTRGLFWGQEESVQLSWFLFFLIIFLFLSLCCIFASAFLLCNWQRLSSGRLSLESQRWGTGDMSAMGTMKLPVWFHQSVCKHRGGGWGVRTQRMAFYSLPSSSGINVLHPHLLLAFILSVWGFFFPSFLFVTDSKGKDNSVCRSCLCLLGLFLTFLFPGMAFSSLFYKGGNG